MKLDELMPLNKSYEELQGCFLVFSAQFLPQLINAQNPKDNMQIKPVALNDGRYFLSADCLTEIGNKGYFKAAFAKLNANNFKFVEVLTTAELEPFKIIEIE